jgi:elongation factor G
MRIERMRNFGISAHIDAGKTTLAERILFLTDRIRSVHEVRGRDGVGATMDTTDIERDRGISVQSAAVTVPWDDHALTVIDTPGHVDFTVEVERALRVLDGAVLLLCAVGGVQAQTRTVDAQMRRYALPRVAFVNKCDRPGADPVGVVEQMQAVLGLNAALVQLPWGLGPDLRGVIDLVEMCAMRFVGQNGRVVERGPIPASMADAAHTARQALLDAVSLHDDALLELLLSDASPTADQLNAAIARQTKARQFVPVLLGSAMQNVGVQPLLDAVCAWLPAPAAVQATVAEVPVTVHPIDDGSAVALAFKHQRIGQTDWTWLRVYRGVLRPRDRLRLVRTGRVIRLGRLARLDAGRVEAVESAGPGEVVAVRAVDCASGDTLVGGSEWVELAPMTVPEPVVEARLKMRGADKAVSKTLARFAREDPTLRIYTDPETDEVRLCGMGELHLEVYLARLREECRIEAELDAPTVSYRQTIGRPATFDHTRRKQTGGPGEYARIVGRIEPCDEPFAFVWRVTGGAIPSEYRAAVRAGFADTLANGPDGGPPVMGVRVVVEDGRTHPNDSSERAFYLGARDAVRAALVDARPHRLEPVMTVVATTGIESQGAAIRSLLQRRGQVVGTAVDDRYVHVTAEVPLAEMFGYASALRSVTAGAGTFTMAFARYAPAPT